MSDSMPLDQSHLDAMNQLLDLVQTALPVAQKCQDCGLDLTQEIQVLKDRADFARKVKRNFFPDQP